MKLRLFLPVSLIITTVVIIVTIRFVNQSIHTYTIQTEKNLQLTVQSLHSMFEREATLKADNVRKNLQMASALFKGSNFSPSVHSFEIQAENQLDGSQHKVILNSWKLNEQQLFENYDFVDSLQKIFGGTVTIFQLTDIGFVRMSTNVLNTDGTRATGTYIPLDSPVSKSILSLKPYFGRAYVVNDWYVTAYEPIVYNNKVIGMLYTGDKEKDINVLRNVLLKLTIGKSGYPFVFDKSGLLMIHPTREGELWADSLLFHQISGKTEGILHYKLDGINKILAFKYFETFELYIAASVIAEDEISELRRDAIWSAVLTGITTILLLLAFIYYFTTERIFKFFTELQKSRKKLISVSMALEESEERFEKLFDSTGDDIFVTDIHENIVEVNRSACETLGYKKEELLQMKITEIKSSKFKDKVSENRKIIYETGSFTFESEHVNRNGQIIPVEFTSRLVSYGNEKLILSVVRNISQRRELERQVLSAVIRTEERERERFARDMHDGLGPLLSTIKLYVNELKSPTLIQDEREELIGHSNELIDEAVNSARNISNNIMPRVIHQYGLIKAVDAFCDKVNKTNTLNIQFESENFEERLDSNLELILFRVISELINNTIRHAHAKQIIILLVKNEKKLSLYFKDDGIGFNTEEIINSENKGMGLKNIISRIKSINGNYDFSSQPNEGFTIKIEINL